jgi:archaemetzincin
VKNIKITIVPLGDVPESILKKVRDELKITFRMIGDIAKVEDMPISILNRYRNQYLSNQLLDFLEKNHGGRILGIIKEDLYTEGLNFIFGQAKLKGRVAIVSICRLDSSFWHQPKDDELLELRIVKETIHEVGHLLGLEHCNRRGCVMNFSNTVGEVDKKTKYLCDMCKLQLGL